MDLKLETVLQSPLFAGIDPADLSQLLACMSARDVPVMKGGAVFRAGDPVQTIGIVTAGVLQIVKEDPDGHQHILAELTPPALFGEAFVCAGVAESPVTVMVAESGSVLLLHYRKLITSCANACPFHTKLIENMLALLAEKNIFLNKKLELLSQRTIRGRLLLFFELYSKGDGAFTVPFSRAEMADFLCVERSALSAELSKMRKDGLLKFRKNEFEWLRSLP